MGLTEIERGINVNRKERLIENMTNLIVPVMRAAISLLVDFIESQTQQMSQVQEVKQITDERLLTIKEAAEFLQVTENAIRKWVSEGRLKARRVGQDIRFLKSEILEWTASQADNHPLRRVK